MEHPYLPVAQSVFLAKGSGFVHNRRTVIPVERFLAGPLVDQEQTFRVVGREEIIVAEATLDGADPVGDATLFHLFHIFAGAPVLSGIPDVDGQLLCVALHDGQAQKGDKKAKE